MGAIHNNYTLTDYQRDAARTINRGLTVAEMTQHAVHGLCAEAGEIASLYQKIYQGHAIDREHLVKEIGDVLWMLAELCTVNDVYLSDAAATNIEKLKARYPEGFTADNSLNRKEGDI